MKRRIAIIMVFLLLGAIVNVAVAWGCALYVDPFGTNSTAIEKGDGETVYVWHRFGATRQLTTRPTTVPGMLPKRSAIILERENLAPDGYWKTTHAFGLASDSLMEERVGWPMLSLVGTNVGTSSGGVRSRNLRTNETTLSLPTDALLSASQSTHSFTRRSAGCSSSLHSPRAA